MINTNIYCDWPPRDRDSETLILSMVLSGEENTFVRSKPTLNKQNRVSGRGDGLLFIRKHLQRTLQMPKRYSGASNRLLLKQGENFYYASRIQGPANHHHKSSFRSPRTGMYNLSYHVKLENVSH